MIRTRERYFQCMCAWCGDDVYCCQCASKLKNFFLSLSSCAQPIERVKLWWSRCRWLLAEMAKSFALPLYHLSAYTTIRCINNNIRLVKHWTASDFFANSLDGLLFFCALCCALYREIICTLPPEKKTISSTRIIIINSSNNRSANAKKCFFIPIQARYLCKSVFHSITDECECFIDMCWRFRCSNTTKKNHARLTDPKRSKCPKNQCAGNAKRCTA